MLTELTDFRITETKRRFTVTGTIQYDMTPVLTILGPDFQKILGKILSLA